MAIRIIQEVPTRLPQARLYLDDIEEISRILQEAAFKSATLVRDDINSEVLTGMSSPEKAQQMKEVLSFQPAIKTKISYSIDQRRMDSITDLETLGGSTTTLDIRVGFWLGTVSLDFNRHSNPHVYLSSLEDEEAWAVFGRIKSIFDRRQLHIKNTVEHLPWWIQSLLWSMLCYSPILLTRFRQSPYFIVGFVVIFGILIVPAYEYFLYPSRVFFIRSHERTKASSETRRQTVRAIILIVVGAVIGGLISESIHHFLFKQP